MYRIKHGETLPIGSDDAGMDSPANIVDQPAASAGGPRDWPFWYMFEDLQNDDKNLLPESSDTVSQLRELGRRMGDPIEPIPGVPVPTVYTFFGQFVDHDITLEKGSDLIRGISVIGAAAGELAPIPLDEIRENIVNSRSPNLELDSVYGSNELVKQGAIPRDQYNREKMKLGTISRQELRPRGKDIYNDLPRRPPSDDTRTDRAALIGDPRNDENLIIAQLHVAFLRAHNALVDRYGCKFDEARKLIRQHYQWIVLEEFLPRVADPAIVKRVRYEGPKYFKPSPGPFFMPLEFAVAAFRFGHSKVRAGYNKFNNVLVGGGATLGQLMTFARFAGDLSKLDSVPGDWVIDWTHFLKADDPLLFSRAIDTTLSPPLLNLSGHGDVHLIGLESNLAIRNLLRGYVLRMPTGQAVAKAMKEQGVAKLSGDQIMSVVPTAEQRDFLTGPGSGLLEKTPLWFYILAEAAYCSRGFHLGPVGSTIVAEVLIEVLRHSDDSILWDSKWLPTIGPHPHKFDIADLLQLAGVL